jgi:hypothetical protein
MRQFGWEIADKIHDWAELPPRSNCSVVLLPGMPRKSCCQPFGDRILTSLPPPMDEPLLDRIEQLTH